VPSSNWISIAAIIISLFAIFISFKNLMRDAKGADSLIACHEAPTDRRYWAWREIAGRKCWFRGSRDTPKSMLSWGPDEDVRRSRRAADGQRDRLPDDDSDPAPVSVTIRVSPVVPGSFEDRWQGFLRCRYSIDGRWRC